MSDWQSDPRQDTHVVGVDPADTWAPCTIKLVSGQLVPSVWVNLGWEPEDGIYVRDDTAGDLKKWHRFFPMHVIAEVVRHD